MFLQGLQDGWRVAVFVTGIKSEKDDFFIGVGGIVGVVGVQLLDGGISGGPLPFLWENLSPQFELGRRRPSRVAGSVSATEKLRETFS